MRSWMHDRGLLLANLGLFFLFFVGMAAFGFNVYNSDQSEHGAASVSFGHYLFTGDFVEATFENWESEFLAIAVMVGASVYLRYRGSAESKPVAASHAETGA